MNCAPADLRDYFFDALASQERTAVRQHLSACTGCAAELDALRLTTVALRSMPEEELPRRIAFVSDKVFEPSPWRRFWQSFWMSGARVGSAAVALLAIAIFVSAFRVPTPSKQVAVTPVARESVTPNSEVDARIQKAVGEAVSQAVARSEARFNVRLDRLATENEKQKRTIERAAEAIDFMNRRSREMTVASNRIFDSEASPAAQ
jgi:anti-sigma factor RsiW